MERIRAILSNPQPTQPTHDNSLTAVDYRAWIRNESAKERRRIQYSVLNAMAETAREGKLYLVDGGLPLSDRLWMELAILIWDGSVIDLAHAGGGSELRLTVKGKRILSEMQQQARR